MIDVSIIIPTFNRAGLVQEAIDSVLCQDLASVEVVVVDDGSTDGTGEALRARYGERIHYCYQSNRGRSAARNLGIQVSSGHYLLFLDSDDLLLPGGLAAEIAFLDAHPEVDVVYTDGTFCDESGQDLARIASIRPPHDPDNLLKDLVLCNVILACHSAVVRRTALDSIGFPCYDEDLRGTEDEDLWVRLAARGKVFAYLDLPTCKYRVHGSNASRYDPDSPAYWKRQESVKRGRFKILYAGFFPRLPAETRDLFFRTLLMNQLAGDEAAREEALGSPQFAALELASQARLLYRLGRKNIVDEAEWRAGQGRLKEAVRLRPGLKYRFVYLLASLWPEALRSLFALKRRCLGQRACSGRVHTSPIGQGGLQPLEKA
ncbi:MAG: glycosyltransferase [Anaerolineae bacterium]|nr:glycosyltransferase [Anaerolineae bacterium]